jgi:hypothetical protein
LLNNMTRPPIKYKEITQNANNQRPFAMNDTHVNTAGLRASAAMGLSGRLEFDSSNHALCWILSPGEAQWHPQTRVRGACLRGATRHTSGGCHGCHGNQEMAPHFPKSRLRGERSYGEQANSGLVTPRVVAGIWDQLRDHTGQKRRYWLVLKEIIRAAPCFFLRVLAWY